MQINALASKHRRDRTETLEYRLYTMLFLPLAFITVVIKRLMPGHGLHNSGEIHRPFLSEVMELTKTTVPWVFMGR